jgi:hypothetical protein
MRKEEMDINDAKNGSTLTGGEQTEPEPVKRKRGRPAKSEEEKAATKARAQARKEALPRRPRGAQPLNQNALKEGDDLRLELFLSKFRRGLVEEWFKLSYGRPPLGETELREAVRKLVNTRLDRALYEEIEQRQPGRFSSTGGEVF